MLICACDTFRAGAVEQLKTHSRCLDVPLFERGCLASPPLPEPSPFNAQVKASRPPDDSSKRIERFG